MITRWSLKSDDLGEDSKVLKKYASDHGVISGGSRKTTEDQLLSWKMILPTPSPKIELVPFMTDWSQSDMHPTDNLNNVCKLQSIQLFHPNPKVIQGVIDELGVECEVVRSDEIRIRIEIQTPNGVKYLD